MKSARISISVSPELYDWVRNQARKQKTSVSRYAGEQQFRLQNPSKVFLLREKQ